MTVAIYGRNIEPEFFPYLKRLVERLESRGVEMVCEEKFAALLKEDYGYEPGFSDRFGRCSLAKGDVGLLLSVGGDGTFLDSVVYVKDSGVPVLGVNSGRLGFLANVPVEEIEDAADFIAAGKYEVEQRDMLQLEVDGQRIADFDYALNEVGVLKVATSSLLKVHAYIGENYLTTYWADGLVVATPTGSTAYSLSGGGPIVSPECRNIILTPICPHNLTIRPLVVPNTAEVRLKVESRSGEYVLSMDSRIRKMADGQELKIRTGNQKVNLVKLPLHNYYDTLRKKLMWGEDRRNGIATRFLTFISLLFPFLLLSLNGFCQPGAELGVSGGVGYYIGEYNPGRHFDQNQRYLGGFYRYNLNDRFALRLNAGFSKIDIRERPLLPNGESVYPDGFHCTVKDIALWVEFNFRSFWVQKVEESSWWSPYLFAGVGCLGAGDEGSVSIPFGIGVKLNLFRQWSCGIEWSARKLFTDKIDHLYDPWGTGETNFIYNKDCFFVAGITISYRFPSNRECHF